MGNALISRRGGGYATIKFENYYTHSGIEHSDAPNLKVARQRLSATTVGDYALFGGGDENGYSNAIDVYNSRLVKGTASSLSAARNYIATTTVGNYALFGGGHAGSANQASAYYSTVDVYNSNLVKSTATNLTHKPNHLAATTVGNYALFAGGETYTSSSVSGDYIYLSTVDTYNSNLVKGTASSLSAARKYLAATTVRDYALFGGGFYYDNNGNSTALSTVDTYNSNLVKGIAPEFSVARYVLAATTVGNYALFGGGSTIVSSSSSKVSTVDAYSSSLTRSSPTGLSAAIDDLAATTVGDYALFGGEHNFSFIDTYTNNLVKGNAPELSVARGNLAATTVGNYALFAGGYLSGYCNTVDAYYSSNTFDIMVYKNSKYKFQNMEEEAMVTENTKHITVPMPITGYIKFKNTTIS